MSRHGLLCHVARVFLASTLACGAGSRGADKSGVSPNTISLPKGPGSVEGLGDSFQPSLNTGTAKYGLGLKLPPGVAGHQPSLGLSYEGGGGNGPLGYGWNLALPSIQRRTDKGIPTYGADVGFPRADVFINEMKEELVPRPDGFFFCKNEGAFIRYRPLGDGWEGTLPNGTKLEFGLSASGRVEEAGAARTFAWLLQRQTDTRGNVIEYGYRSFGGAQNLNQKYLALVRYGPGAPPWTHYHFAAFEYEDRPDWFEDGRAGFLMRTGKRLKSIVVGTQGVALSRHLAGDFDDDGTTDYLNRRYDLAYLQYAGASSHWSLLEKVTLVGADGVSALPPATFSYSVSHPPDELSAQGHIWGTLDEPFSVMDNELVDLIDLNADGLPDILKTEAGGGAHTVSVNRGPVPTDGGWAIHWAAPTAVDPGIGAAWNFDLASERTHLADMDGDGLADLVHRSADDAVFFFANRGSLAWGARQDMALQESAPPSPFGAADVRTADVDFDKRIDIIQSIDFGGGIGYRVWFNLAHQAYSPPVTVESEGGFAFALPGVQLADGNGDRVPDIARIQPGAVMVAAGLGYGRFAEPRAIGLPDFTLDELQIARAKFTDINGDGLADLVIERTAPGTCWYWINLGNFTFSSRKTIVGLPGSLSQGTAVRWADLNGNGTVDLVYADREATPRIQMVELGQLVSGGLAPNLLTRIDNGIGRVTRIDYAPSTRFALADAAAGRPWPNALPFPVTVVAGITVADSLGHEYTTQFRYHDGFYDAAEKQFRGFARVEQVEVGDPTAPTLVTRSHFDTGHEFEAMKGKLLRLTAEQSDGGVFWDEVTTWISPPRALAVGINGETVRFAHPVASRKEILELGAGAARRLESEFTYDDYGNQTGTTNYGIVEGANRAAFNDERATSTEFALNLGAWIIRHPKRLEVQDANGVAIARSEFFYDDESFSGNNLGSVTIGNLTLRRDWITPSNAMDFVPASRTKYDAHGNAITLLDPLADGTGNAASGHFIEVTYDAGFRSHPIRETIHVGGGAPALVFHAAYDEGLSTTVSSTDFNGHRTEYGHDALGRLIHIVKPGDTPAYPTAEYDYALAVPVGPTGRVNYVETRALDKAPGSAGAAKRDHYFISRQFADGLGRSLMSKEEAEPDPASSNPRVAVKGAVLFNARQKPSHELNPFYSLAGNTLDALLAYEDIGAPGWQGAFHQSGHMVSLGLEAAHQTSTEYDASLRAILTRNAEGTSAHMVYEPLVTRSLDENDTDPASPHFATPMAHWADGLGRLIRVDEIVRLQDDGSSSGTLNTWTTRYEYDANDSLTRLTDSQNNVKLLQYDGLRRKTFMNDPDRGVMTYAYDAASNLIETRDAKAQRITFAYDGANRILSEDYHDESSTEFSYQRTPDIAFFYDQAADLVDNGDGTRFNARNTWGQLAYVQDASGEEHTSYDARGRVEGSLKRITDPSHPASLVAYATRFEYDSLDRLTRLIYPDNDQVTYEYNARSLLGRITGGPSGSIVSGIEYLPSGQQVGIDYGNGVRTTYAYDSRLRLNNLRSVSQPATSNDSLIDFAYRFDRASNIQSIQDQRDTAVVSATDKRRNSQSFAYDDLYRLSQVRYNVPAPSSANGGEIRYQYDRIGNLLTQTSDITHLENGQTITAPGAMAYGGAAGRSGRQGRPADDPPGPHALTSIRNTELETRNYSYDANGNMTDIDGLACTWDFQDRLIAVEDATMRAEYRYDYSDRRVTKRVVSKGLPVASGAEALTTTYVGKHFEVRAHDQPTKYVFNGGTRVARITGSLSTNTRIQRFRLQPGWNLISLAVTAPTTLQQLTNTPVPVVQPNAVVRWSQPLLTWLPVSADETLPAGTVLWVRAVTNATVALTGSYSDPGNRTVPAGGSFQSSLGFDAVPLFGSAAAIRADVALAHFDAGTQGWQRRLPLLPQPDRGFPEFLAPGRAIFMKADAPAELEPAPATLHIRFYHQDHLGSSSVITDAAGALVEETAFYPFGSVRQKSRPRPVDEPYQFTQKERDQESGLDYFEARYLAGPLSRFITADPKYANPDALSGNDRTSFLSNPQEINLYAYVGNNPLSFVDPTGLDRNDHITFKTEFAAAAQARKESGVTIGVDWDRVEGVAEFPLVMVKEGIFALLGVNTANAPGHETKTYPSLTYGEHAKNVAIQVGGGKLAKSVGTKLFGGSGPSATAGGVSKSATTVDTVVTSAGTSVPGRVGGKGQSIIAVADTMEHSAGSIFAAGAREAQLARKMAYIHQRIIETAPQRAAAMDAFNRGYNTKGAGAIIKMIGDEATALFGNITQ